MRSSRHRAMYGDDAGSRSAETKRLDSEISAGVPAYTPNAGSSIEAVMDLYQSQNLQFLSLIHVGMDGWVKCVEFVPFSLSHLRDILSSGERCDGSSLFKGTGLPTSSSDISLRPRLSTAFVHPFTDEDEPRGLCVLCDHLDKQGYPLPQSPSTILKAAHDRVKQECDGLELFALGEVEYFLGRHQTPDEKSLSSMLDKSEKGYHSTSPFMFGSKLRRQTMAILTNAGFHVKYGHGEVGFIPAEEAELEETGSSVVWEQHEIEMSLMPLEQAADAVVVCQWILRNLAEQAGFLVSFDPIVRRNHAGNGLHFHMSPTRDGMHLFHYQDSVANRQDHPVERHKELMPEVQAMIAGLCICGGSLMAFGNRTDMSYVRLLQGNEAPTKVEWDFFNRKALVRLPIQSQNAQGETKTPATIEFRLGDGSAHPHLLLAGIAQAFVHAYHDLDQAALLEVVDRCRVLPRGQDDDQDDEKMTPVPKNASEVAHALAKDSAIYTAGGVFPPSMVDGAIEAMKCL